MFSGVRYPALRAALSAAHKPRPSLPASPAASRLLSRAVSGLRGTAAQRRILRRAQFFMAHPPVGGLAVPGGHAQERLLLDAALQRLDRLVGVGEPLLTLT